MMHGAYDGIGRDILFLGGEFPHDGISGFFLVDVRTRIVDQEFPILWLWLH